MLVVLGVGIVTNLLWGFICNRIVKGKGYPDNCNSGVFWGFFLGIIGLLVCISKPSYLNTEEGLRKHEAYYRQPQVQPPPQEPVTSTSEQITEMKKLLDEGLITEEEFTAKKKQILGL